jgi:hypothetical protein
MDDMYLQYKKRLLVQGISIVEVVVLGKKPQV